MSLTKFTQRTVHTVDRSGNVVDAARKMIEASVGALVITDPKAVAPVGIVTDRDLLVVVAEGMDLGQTKVSDLMRSPLYTVSIDESLGEVTEKMRKHGIRRLPIVDSEGRLIGIVSLDDILTLLGHEMSDVARTIESEIVHEAATMAVRAKLARGTP